MNFFELGKETTRKEIELDRDYYFSEESNIGDKLGHFKILKLLGKGAYGKVYKVLSLINSQIYAMKIFDKNIDKIKVNLNNIFNHPNIIRIYKSFEENEKLYIIMEYMNNGNLKDFILMNKDTDNIFEENQIWSFLLQSVWALFFIHNKGYILRNIKPENILIDDNMKIKFGEFLSTQIKQEENNEVHPYESLEDCQIWEDTKKYMSKIIKGKQADIYSLGLILKELLDNNDCDKKINKIIREMNKEEGFDELTKNQRTEMIFETIGNFYSEKQNNSSIDSIILCLKSFKCFENEFKNERTKNNLKKNYVFDTLNKILSELIYNQKSDFIYWNRYINELRMALIEENNLLEGIEEIEPENAYLQIMKIIIDEKIKMIIKDNPSNIFTPNIIKYNIVNLEDRDESNSASIKYYNYINENNEILKSSIIKDILGLMKIETKCTKCNLSNIEFRYSLMMELNPREILTEGKEEQKIELESIITVPKEKELKINCRQCSEITVHKYISGLYSLPNALVIYIRESLFDDKNCVNIKETMEINDCDKYLNEKKKYELVAMLKKNRNKNEQLFYSLSKFNERWFLSQRYKGIEPIEMNCSHTRSNRVRMVFYQSNN